jgi:hypothetical protein
VLREDPFTDYYVWVDPKGFDDQGNPIPPSNWVTFAQIINDKDYLHMYVDV